MLQQNDQQKGVLFTLTAFSWWGILVPIYFKSLTGVDAFEIVAHRIIWSFIFLLLMMFWLKKPPHIFNTLKKPGLRWGLFVTGLLISFNWLLSVWAITHNQILATSLGYFINPLVSVMLGVIFLGESLNNRQVFALFLVFMAVLNQIWQYGQVPWIGLGLAISFGFYGLLRKKMVVDPYTGLLVEVIFVLPAALGYLLLMIHNNSATFLSTEIEMNLLLTLSGVITTVPMILFVKGTKLIKLSTVGFLQYLIPTLSFALAIFVYQEPLGSGRLLSFALIWMALLLISWDTLRHHTNLFKV